MEIGSIKDILPSCIHPHFFRNSLAYGTAVVAAGIVMDLYWTAVFTYIRAISIYLTVHDVMRSLWFVPKKVNTGQGMPDKNAEKYPIPWVCPSSVPSYLSKGLRIPIRDLLLTWRWTSVDFGSRCPNSTWIFLCFTPCFIRWVAKLWRRQCGVTPDNPAADALRRITCSSVLTVRYCSINRFGNRMPLGLPFLNQYSVRGARFLSERIV